MSNGMTAITVTGLPKPCPECGHEVRPETIKRVRSQEYGKVLARLGEIDAEPGSRAHFRIKNTDFHYVRRSLADGDVWSRVQAVIR